MYIYIYSLDSPYMTPRLAISSLYFLLRKDWNVLITARARQNGWRSALSVAEDMQRQDHQ